MTHALASRWPRNVASFSLMCVLAGLAEFGAACDTPVYRYAMYRWHPAPYELYYFHDGQPNAEHEAIVTAVERLCADATAPANLIFLPVDLQQDEQLTDVPPDIKEAWDKHSSKQTPWYLISSPVGVHLFGGSVSETDIAALVDSPVRQQVGQLLEQGKAGVYVLVTTDNQSASELAEKEIRGVIDDVAAGKISLYTSLSQPMDENAPPTPAIEFGLVKVARSDASEKWFLDCLMTLEPDLHSSTEPLAFLVYGRGRALFSSLGKGIHRDNLIQDVEFITGACSCTVKEQNPGVDLLMRYDWDSVAEALMQRFGTEEGSPYRFGSDSLFPELIIPPEEPAAPAAQLAADQPGTVPETVAPNSVATLQTAATSSTTAPSTTDVVPAAAQATQPAAAQQLVLNSPPASATESLASTTPNPWRAVFWVGGGLLGALVVLFGATFLVLRPR